MSSSFSCSCSSSTTGISCVSSPFHHFHHLFLVLLPLLSWLFYYYPGILLSPLVARI